MARQELDMSHEAEEKRLELLWDAYKAQEDELIATQQELESAMAAREKLEDKLEAEEERLQKLWDAFKVQEDELKEVKERVPLMEEKLIERERTIESLQRDISLLEPLTEKGKYVTDVERENTRLKADIEVLEARLKAKGDDAKPQRVTGSAQEAKQLQQELDAERERLEKLYSLYQDQETEVKHLKQTIKDWEAWAKKVQPVEA